MNEGVPSEVVVVGLGPTGLALALALGRCNVGVCCVEPLIEPSAQPRAASCDDWARRVLEMLCLESAEHFRELSTQLVSANVGGTILFEIPDGLKTGNGCAPINFFFQPALEQVLRKELEKMKNVKMLLGWQVNQCREDEVNNTVVVELYHNASGVGATLRSSFVVGCDGASSVVRKNAGLSLNGTSFEREGAWLVVDVLLPPGWKGLKAFRFICDPARPGLDLPLPNGHARFEWVLNDDELGIPSQDIIRQWIVARGVPLSVAKGAQFVRCARYVFHARECVPQWCSASRRLLVAGDAAHLTPPMRGQGMSSGIADANNLAWKLACVVQGVAPLNLLDTFQQERRHRVIANTHIAVWLNQLISSRWNAFCTARNWVMPLVWRAGRLLFGERDTMIASTTLVASLAGPVCDMTALVGTLLPHHEELARFWSSGSHLFFLLVRNMENCGCNVVQANPKWVHELRGCLVEAPWISVRYALLVRRDMHIMAAWHQQPPSASFVEELVSCLKVPRLQGMGKARAYNVLSAALRVISPQVVVFFIILAIVGAGIVVATLI